MLTFWRGRVYLFVGYASTSGTVDIAPRFLIFYNPTKVYKHL